jgi:hypothetical protein
MPSRHGKWQTGLERASIDSVILVDEGAQRLVLATVPNGRPCAACDSEQRVVAVRYQVFGFFGAFGASWARHYFIECRQCRTTLSAIERAEFETPYGNAIPFGQRYGLLALGSRDGATGNPSRALRRARTGNR